MAQESDGMAKGLIVGFIAGSIVGAAIALLYAPKAGKELRAILATLCKIKTLQERDIFIQIYADWVRTYSGFVSSLPRTTIALKDLKRTMVLINNALPDMFHYLTDSNVPSTTNSLEGFHSRLKSDYQRHRGLTKEHRIQYIHWYCYYQNG